MVIGSGLLSYSLNIYKEVPHPLEQLLDFKITKSRSRSCVYLYAGVKHFHQQFQGLKWLLDPCLHTAFASTCILSAF